MKPKIIVFASGTKDSGGSGFENLVDASRTGVLDAEIVAVVSNHENGGVKARAQMLGIPFVHFDGTRSHKEIFDASGAQWSALSGWWKIINGLDPRTTFNIHPALLSFDHGRFGGKGMFGPRTHEAVKTAFDAGELKESGFTMHFVTEEYDKGPIFFEYRVPLQAGMSSEEIQKLVNAAEHEWQPKITNLVVREEISWDGKNPKSLKVPDGYLHLPKP